MPTSNPINQRNANRRDTGGLGRVGIYLIRFFAIYPWVVIVSWPVWESMSVVRGLITLVHLLLFAPALVWFLFVLGRGLLSKGKGAVSLLASFFYATSWFFSYVVLWSIMQR